MCIYIYIATSKKYFYYIGPGKILCIRQVLTPHAIHAKTTNNLFNFIYIGAVHPHCGSQINLLHYQTIFSMKLHGESQCATAKL